MDMPTIPPADYDKLTDAQESLYDPGDGVKGETALWRAVITQALMDAGSNSKKRVMKYNKAQAISWLCGKGDDFITVCTLAGLDPADVRRKAKAAIARGCIWKDMKEKMHRTHQPKLPVYDVKKKRIVEAEAGEKSTGEVILFKTEVG